MKKDYCLALWNICWLFQCNIFTSHVIFWKSSDIILRFNLSNLLWIDSVLKTPFLFWWMVNFWISSFKIRKLLNRFKLAYLINCADGAVYVNQNLHKWAFLLTKFDNSPFSYFDLSCFHDLGNLQDMFITNDVINLYSYSFQLLTTWDTALKNYLEPNKMTIW